MFTVGKSSICLFGHVRLKWVFNSLCFLLEVRPPGKTSPGKLLFKTIANGLDSSEEKQNKHVFSLAHCNRIVWGMQLCRPQATEVSSSELCQWIKMTFCMTITSLYEIPISITDAVKDTTQVINNLGTSFLIIFTQYRHMSQISPIHKGIILFTEKKKMVKDSSHEGE